MMPSKSQSFIKPSLSQLLLRSMDKLEDPKYATVPQSHTDEMRPSILEQYQQCKDNFMNSHEQSLMAGCNSKSTLEHTSSRSKYNSKPLTLRALNWSIEPLWRYCASKIHLELEHGAKRVTSAIKAKHSKKDYTTNSSVQSLSQLPITSNLAGKSKLKSKKNKKCTFSNNIPPTDEHELPSQCSRPAFEVLPPLFENRTHTLLYQNSYLLDGVKYDYGRNKANQEQSVSTKLRLNYLKFLKSVNEETKPSDREVIFGEAKVIFNPTPHWESSRIDWLTKLEQQQEARKSQYAELKNNTDTIKQAKTSSFKPHHKGKKKNMHKENIKASKK